MQHHGSGADGLDEAFEAAGADVVSLTIYRWGPPPDIAVVPLLVAGLAVAAVLPVFFYPFSKTTWTAVDLAMTPLEPGEAPRLAGTPQLPG